MPRATKQERAEAIADLRKMLQPGDEVYTQCQHVSASGLTRWLDVFVIRDNRPHRITWPVCAAADFIFCDRRGQLKIEGCGMDMGFSAVYSLGRALWPNGTDSPHGTRNGEPDTDGGYALKQRWL